MQQKSLQHLLATVVQIQREEDVHEEDVIRVSETISVAVSIYETVRNTLEYDEEHLLRRNAIRRILKRRLAEGDVKSISAKLIRELIWSKYLLNNRVPTATIDLVAEILEKYKLLFAGLEDNNKEEQQHHEWLLDVLSTEIEYVIGPPCVDEALASYAYQALKERIKWQTTIVSEEERELQLYTAIHRAVLHSNIPTLRYRILTLYYPKWRTAAAGDIVVQEITENLSKVIASVEGQIHHEAAETIYRFVRPHAIVFRLIADVAKDNPKALSDAIQNHDLKSIDHAITAAANERYAEFRSRLVRTVVRAALFLLLTKSILALLIEYPYELLVLGGANYFPLAINILFPPLLLACIGLSIQIPKKKNTAKILEEARAFLMVDKDFHFVFKQKRPWTHGVVWMIFNALYFFAFFGVIWFIAVILRSFDFSGLSIAFFIFFLSLVAYFGIRIRNTRRELMLVETGQGPLQILGDVLFLPFIRAGRWISLHVPLINVFLFFFDFIIEAPFKAAVEIVENWFVFLKEKREEI